jgi:hypothetical protein
MCRIESYNGLRELENAWALLPRLYDTAEVVSGILVCVVHRGENTIYRRSISTTAGKTARTSHTLGAVEYWGQGLDVFILRNSDNV